MRGLMVCGEFPDIRCGRITLALKNHGVTHGVTTLRVPPQLGHVYDFIDWNHTDGAKRLIDRALAHDPDIYHVHGELHQFWPVVELKKRTDKPVILNVHDLASARPGTALDRYEEEAIDAADALVWVTEEQRLFAASLGLGVGKPYVIIPNHASSSVFIEKRVLPYIGGVVLHGGMVPRDDEQTSLDHSPVADALGGKLHLYPGGQEPDYGIVHRMEVNYNLLIHRLSQHDWGFCGTANPDHVWSQALPTKVGEYLAAGIPFIALNCPPVKPLCDAGMGIYLTDVRDLPKAAATPTKAFKKAVMHNRSRFTTERAIEPLVRLYRELGA